MLEFLTVTYLPSICNWVRFSRRMQFRSNGVFIALLLFVVFVVYLRIPFYSLNAFFFYQQQQPQHARCLTARTVAAAYFLPLTKAN